jgi:hypothetical protein
VSLASGALRHGLADLVLAHGDRPLAGVAAALEQHSVVGVDGEDVGGGDKAVRFRRVGVVRYSVRPEAIRFPLRATAQGRGVVRLGEGFRMSAR